MEGLFQMIAQITDHIFLSGENFDRSDLENNSIQAILNVGENVNDPIFDDIVMIKIGIWEFKPNPEFLIALATQALKNLIDNGYRVLVHCKAGVHRSPYIIAKYLVETSNKSLEQAYVEIISKVPWEIIYPPQIK